MKLEINVKQIQTPDEPKDHMIGVRVKHSDWLRLQKASDNNVSRLVRHLILEFLKQAEKEKNSWTRS